MAAPTPCPGQSTRQHESAVRPVLVHREHNHCCTVAMVIWKTFQALAAESHHKQCYTAGQDSRHTAQLKRVDICCQADKRGKAQKKHSSFSFFLGGGGVLLPFHYLPTMNFEKENKPQRKTRVLQRRPGRSSTKKASTAAWHCQKLSCQESIGQEHHRHVGSAAKPGVAAGNKEVKHPTICQHAGHKQHLLCVAADL